MCGQKKEIIFFVTLKDTLKELLKDTHPVIVQGAVKNIVSYITINRSNIYFPTFKTGVDNFWYRQALHAKHFNGLKFFSFPAEQ